jgi:hypothetical protein
MCAALGKGLSTQTDYERWAEVGNLEEWWESRTAAMARLVPPGVRVIEFGAGRRRLPRYLEPGCSYIASDVVAHAPDTLVCDLNQRPLPDLGHLSPDVAVFAGVVEYVADVPGLVQWLQSQVRLCVVSYDAADPPGGVISRLVELARRRRCGYMNAYAATGFVTLFTSAGFTCTRTDIWHSQRLFVFERAR